MNLGNFEKAKEVLVIADENIPKEDKSALQLLSDIRRKIIAKEKEENKKQRNELSGFLNKV